MQFVAITLLTVCLLFTDCCFRTLADLLPFKLSPSCTIFSLSNICIIFSCSLLHLWADLSILLISSFTCGLARASSLSSSLLNSRLSSCASSSSISFLDPWASSLPGYSVHFPHSWHVSEYTSLTCGSLTSPTDLTLFLSTALTRVFHSIGAYGGIKTVK